MITPLGRSVAVVPARPMECEMGMDVRSGIVKQEGGSERAREEWVDEKKSMLEASALIRMHELFK